jgi:hypothetical protein
MTNLMVIVEAIVAASTFARQNGRANKVASSSVSQLKRGTNQHEEKVDRSVDLSTTVYQKTAS